MRLLHASSFPHSGYTSVENATYCPSGDHNGSETPVEIVVTFLASPPSTGITKRFGSPSRSLIKAIRWPSGEKAGEYSFLSPRVNCRTSDPSMFIIHKWLWRVARGRSEVPSV